MKTPKLKPLAEQVIVVTGASSGIGLVTARAAAARGARVLLVARGGDALVAAVRAIEAAGGVADFAIADVGVLGEVQAAAAKAVARFGRIDSWVNCAGVAIYGKLVDTPMDEHRQLFGTNYFGVVHGALTAIENLQREGGALITVASIVADIPSPVMGAYAASKHAVKGYIEALRIEIAADRLPIAVTLIKPSGISTPIAQHAANHVDGEARLPPPVYDPQLVADAILDAAEHPHRDVTVGGIGRLQALLATHFPAGLDLLGPLLMRTLHDPATAPTRSDNLAAPVGDGDARSARQPGRRISLYGTRPRRRTWLALGAAAVGAAALAGARQRSRQRG